MKISKEEILHIANLSNLKINENEIEEYTKNLHEILEFTNTVNEANVEGLDITIGINEASNRFRKDEIKAFEDNEALLKNAPSKELNMFKIPKVI